MSSPNKESRGIVTLGAEVYPETVDAGAELVLEAYASCDPPCDLSGHVLTLTDQNDAEQCVTIFLEFDGQMNFADVRSFPAPSEPGEYRWSLACPAHSESGVSYDAVSIPIAFSVKAHATQIVAWDVPTTIVAGEKFGMKIGIRCSSDCDLSGKKFLVCDHTGSEIANAAVSGAIWPGTKGLYFAGIELQAPAENGLYDWSVSVANSDAPPPHGEGKVNFGVRVVDAPDCTVTVEAFNVDGAPLRGAHVTMHPYQAETDESGAAQLRVTKGTYRLFVAKGGYLNFALPLELPGDLTIRAELEVEVLAEKN
jgi:hypothetical protein